VEAGSTLEERLAHGNESSKIAGIGRGTNIREIGILRCLGARARDVRRIFATEGVTLALAGWLLGLPLGYALTRLIVRLIWEIAGVRLPLVFPFWNIWIALAGTLALALIVLLLPLRRVVRFRPGDALRYA
jgi:putative ABC transport system permease protein